MLVAAAVCPCPPVLIPEVANGAAPELDGLRAACDDAVARLVECRPDRIVLVGPGLRATYDEGDAGSLRPYGVDMRAALGRDRGGRPLLPLSLTVGAWLLGRTGWTGDVEAHAVPDEDGATACAALGAELADRAERVALLALGDASARRSEKAPGYVDGRAEPFDVGVAGALGAGDTGALLRLDPDLARDLLAVGRPAWQVLAGAADAAGPGPETASKPFEAVLLHDAAPYGVGYLVASWVRRG